MRTEVLEGRRADYGAQVVVAVGKQLGADYGRGFGVKNLHRMVQFSSVFPDTKIVAALLRQLGWTHFTILIPIKDSLKREFYAEMCRVEHWSTRDLRERLDSMLYERTALSKKPETLIRQELSALREKGELTPALVFRDPYIMRRSGICGPASASLVRHVSSSRGSNQRGAGVASHNDEPVDVVAPRRSSCWSATSFTAFISSGSDPVRSPRTSTACRSRSMRLDT